MRAGRALTLALAALGAACAAPLACRKSLPLREPSSRETTLGFPPRRGGVEKALKRAPLRFPSGREIVVEVADTPADREVGLMRRRELPKDYGMLFVFPQPMGLRFWMKDTFVPLDIVYIGEDKRITRVHNRVAASREDTPEDKVARVGGYGQFVLELPAGRAELERLAPGDALLFGVRIPDR